MRGRVGAMSKSEKDNWGDTLRAAERARENLYFAKIDEQLIQRMRAEQGAGDPKKRAGKGDCPQCNQPLRSGSWRDLEIEYCPGCGGVWLDQGDLLDLAGRGELDLRLKTD